MKKWKVILIFILVLAAGTGGYFLFSGKKEVSYQTVKIERGEITKTISTTGNLKYKKSVGVYSKVDGIVKKVFVDFNQFVKTGRLLALIDNSLLKLSLEEARHNLLKALLLHRRNIVTHCIFLSPGLNLKKNYRTQNIAMKVQN